MSKYDAIVIGSGPNGLSAAVELARQGAGVLVVEAAAEIGGGTRTAALILSGFQHDFCSAVHPMGVLSPFWQKLPLDQHGLQWIYPEASVAHPLDDEPAVLLTKDLAETAGNLGLDGRSWKRMIRPLLRHGQGLVNDALGPLGIPRHPLIFLWFGLQGMLPATSYARIKFRRRRGRAVFGGCAAHSALPLEKPFSGAVGLIFALTAHLVNWPVAAGGSQAITKALAGYLRQLGGEIQTDFKVTQLNQLPESRVVLFDTDPLQLAAIAGEALPTSYRRRLQKYNFGPGVFKLDWALDQPISWADPRCLQASTVHIGGTLEEIALSERDAWYGRHAQRPFLILCQQSQFDPDRAPDGQHTGYAYCHVPGGSTVDMTEAIENQVERFAPGFKETILARHKTNTQDFFHYNPNYVGGAITGGAADMTQLFTRPVARLDPYSTPNPRLFLCSHSTPPGGGVHGMCGYHAARSALRRF
ncbi:MAG: NAD(P)/FAD-dependent oxidoreductase [Ardenticatenaceae bacterium]|nr:NAD(P)/FAD-dependent oxidoreductase [Ardenticatenaceae bacterium]